MDNTEAMVTMIADVEIASLEREWAEAFAKLDMSACLSCLAGVH